MARKPKGEIQKAINELQELVKSRQILDYSEEDLSKRLGLTEKTIRKHLKLIRVETGSRTIDAITQTFLNDFDSIMNEIKKQFNIARKENNGARIMYYTNQLSKAWVTFADLLERFGIKPKIADKIELQGVIVHANIDISEESQKIMNEING